MHTPFIRPLYRSVWNPAQGTSQDIQPQESVNTLQWSANNKVLALGGNHGSVALYSAGECAPAFAVDCAVS